MQFGPGVIAHVAVGFENSVEHVVVEEDEDAVFRRADVHLVAVAAEFERRAIGFERVLVREFGRAAMANHGYAFAPLR